MAGNIKLGGQFPGGSSGGTKGTVTEVDVQGGPFLKAGTITVTGTVTNSVASLTAHGVLLGEGTSPAGVTAAGTDGQLLIATTAADPAFTTMSGDATITKAGALTVSRINGNPLASTTPTSANLLIANGSSWASVGLTGDIAINAGGTATVSKINGNPLASTTPTSANLLIANGSSWASIAMSGDATINATGTITVSKVGGTTPVTAANFGALVNAGTVQIEQNVTLAGTAGGTLTISPGSGTKISVVNLDATGGTQTLAYAGAYNFQSSRIHLKQGATVSAVVLNTGTVGGFVFGASGSPTSFTVTPTVGAVDEIAIEAPTTAYARIMAIAQGYTA